jgi:Uma2 family endonuclease
MVRNQGDPSGFFDDGNRAAMTRFPHSERRSPAYTIFMIALAKHVPRDDDPQEDHCVHLHGATWADYERLLELRGERAVPRITFFEGTIEIMSPSHLHEAIKSWLGRLVEAWCFERGVEFSTFGSWTLQRRKRESGLEPDECYVFGELANPVRPDLAIEVVWTSGGIRKLDVYRHLGVAEVWFWRKGRISVHCLRDGHYEEVPSSEALPGIDLEQLVSFLDHPTTSQAVRDYRAALQADP